jgi:DUF4097 and DUF4098 domain-containing protein YvlB
MRRSLLLIGIVAFSFVLSGCDLMFMSFNWDDYKYIYEDTQTLTAENAKAIEIKLHNGKVDVEGYSGDEVRVDIEERIKAPSESRADEIAEDIEVTVRRVGDRVLIEPEYKDEKLYKRHWACVLKVKIPRQLEVALRTTNGSIYVENIRADLNLKSTNGSINVSDCRGFTKVQTTNGSINTTNIDGNLEASSTNGALRIEDYRFD